MGNIIQKKINNIKCQTQKFSWISPLVDKPLEESQSNSLLINAQRPLRISELSAQEKKVLENQENHFTIRDQASIESLPNSWPKEEISLPDTPEEVISQWLMQDQTPTEVNSSYVSSHATGSMENIAFSEELLTVSQFLMLLSQLDPEVDKLKPHA